MRGRVLMVQGCTSSAGKSLIVTGLCRLLRQEGLRVAPFKAQNMSNNAFVTVDGGEIGRAQAVQAEAAGVAPDVRMNPVLLKPEADHRSQVVVLGRPAFHLDSVDFLTRKTELWPVVTSALDELRAEYDVVLIEGAGSPAEINLRAADIVNMRVALHAQAPVLLAGDIDRGGVFAHLYGTLALLEPEERALVKGLVINKFRGVRSLLTSGLADIEELTDVPVAAVLPYLPDLRIADEDAVSIQDLHQTSVLSTTSVDVVVPALPRIANFDDLDALKGEPHVTVRYVEHAAQFGNPDLVIIPGTKATMADLAWLRQRGLDAAVVTAHARGAAVVGICGGFQMLGHRINDPGHVESSLTSIEGLGLLPVTTRFEAEKETRQVQGTVVAGARTGLLEGSNGLPIHGYEIHMGQTPVEGGTFSLRLPISGSDPWLDGVCSADGWVLGSYVHGLFDNHEFRQRLLHNIARHRGKHYEPGTPLDRQAEYDRLASTLRAEFNLELLAKLLDMRGHKWAHSR